MRLVAIVLSLSILTPLEGRAARADDWPYPPGRSSPVIEGLTVELDLPRELSKDKTASMVVILHGAGGTATGMAGSLREWTGLGYVICAPKSTDQTWSAPDIQAVKRIAEHMKSVLPIDPAKVHVVGFSNGGWNLDPLAFDDALHPCSATWIAAGCRTGSAPKWAKKGLGVLALAGTEDGNAKSAAETVKILDGKVRCVEARFQPRFRGPIAAQAFRKARTAPSNSRGRSACSQCPAPGMRANRAAGNSALIAGRCSRRT